MSVHYEVHVDYGNGKLVRAPQTGNFEREEMALTICVQRNRQSMWKTHTVVPVHDAPIPSRSPLSTEAYRNAEKEGTLAWRRVDIYHFLLRANGPMTADDYYAAQETETTGYGTQFALLRRAGYIRAASHLSRKKTRSGAYATAYAVTDKPTEPGWFASRHFKKYQVPIRATIKEAIALLEVGGYEAARTLLEDLLID